MHSRGSDIGLQVRVGQWVAILADDPNYPDYKYFILKVQHPTPLVLNNNKINTLLILFDASATSFWHCIIMDTVKFTITTIILPALQFHDPITQTLY